MVLVLRVVRVDAGFQAASSSMPRHQRVWQRWWSPSFLHPSTLLTTLRVFHELDRTGTTVIPTGAKAIKANLMCCTPKGMPTMLTKQARAELR